MTTGSHSLGFCSRFLMLSGIAAALSVADVPAQAQTRAERDIAQRLQRMERDLNDLSRDYYGKVAPSAPGAPAMAPESPEARMGVRLDQIENNMRRLTGQMEEVSHRLSQTQNQLNKLSADFDFSQTGVSPPAPGETSSLSVQPQTGPRSLDPGLSGNGSAATSVGELAPGERSLGTVPTTAVDAVTGTASAPSSQSAPVMGSSVTAARQAMVANGAQQQQYDIAMATLRRGDYAGAETAFSQFISQYPETPLAGNAQYWLGETFYVRQNYEQAAVAFLEGYRTYPESAKAPDSLLKLAMTLNQMGEKKEACLTFDEFHKKFPNASSTIAERARSERVQAGCS